MPALDMFEVKSMEACIVTHLYNAMIWTIHMCNMDHAHALCLKLPAAPALKSSLSKLTNQVSGSGWNKHGTQPQEGQVHANEYSSVA